MKEPIGSLPHKSTRKHNLEILYFLGFFLALASAIPTYIESNYIQQFVNLRWVSLMFVSANVLTFATILFYPEYIRRFRNDRVSKIVILINFVSLLAMALANAPWNIWVFFILLSVSFNLIWINMDIFVEDYIARGAIGRIRTTFYTFMNLGWAFSPLITSLFINDGSYRVVFLIAALCLIPFYVVFARRGKNLRDHVAYDSTEIMPTWQRIRRDKDISSIFILSFFLQLFYSLAVVYVPIYLHQTLGFDWGTLGIIFAVMLVPFVIFEIPAGILADKYIGEKEIMTAGFTILIISLFLFFYVDSTSAWVWGAILFFSRIGAALIESMRESYFFKKVSVKNVGIINFFRTAAPLGYIIGPLFGAIILRFYPVNYIFLILAVLFVSSFFFISRFADTK